MRTVAFDGRMGASGDMIVGALLAVGGDPGVLEPIEAATGCSFDITERSSHGIEATDVTVRIGSNSAEGHHNHRSFTEVTEIVERMPLAAVVKQRSVDAFRLLGEAEATVHGTTRDEIHFHEVGADDAIADVTGAAALIDDLDADRVVTGPLCVGRGEIDTSHGRYPVPPPAVVEIAARTDLSIRDGPVEAELLTPTGAAMLGAWADPVETLPPLDLEGVGYGVGDRSFPNRPNVLRALVGSATGRLEREDISLLETHLDDATPEILGRLHHRLREVGALDVAIVPMTMKKSRPGHLVKVVVTPTDEQRIARTLAEETGTLGVRVGPATHRWVAERSIRTVDVSIDGSQYEVAVKIATDEQGETLDVSAEFDDAVVVADATGRPVRTVMQMAESAVRGE